MIGKGSCASVPKATRVQLAGAVSDHYRFQITAKERSEYRGGTEAEVVIPQGLQAKSVNVTGKEANTSERRAGAIWDAAIPEANRRLDVTDSFVAPPMCWLFFVAGDSCFAGSQDLHGPLDLSCPRALRRPGGSHAQAVLRAVRCDWN